MRSFVLFAALFAAGHCQFLRNHYGGNSFSSSFTSSSSWMQGQDGNMHKQLQQSRFETVKDANGMQQKRTQVICQDGDCSQAVEVKALPAMQKILPMTMIPPGLKELHFHIQGKLAVVQDMLKQIAGVGILRSAPFQSPDSIAVSLGPGGFLAPHPASAKGMRLEIEPLQMLSTPTAVSHPTAWLHGLVARGKHAWLHGKNMLGHKLKSPTALLHGKTPFVILKLCAVVSVVCMAILMIACVLHRALYQRASARESPLRKLAEPLAPGEGTVVHLKKSAKKTKAAQKGAKKTKTDATAPMATENEGLNAAASTYLHRVYSRHMARELKSGVATYLRRVYSRQVA